MSLAINLLTYNGATAFIREALGSVYAFTDEIRVYDTGSTDDTVALVKNEFPKVVLSEYPIQHLGQTWTESRKDKELTRLLNQIKSETKAEWILKIDDDEIFPACLMREVLSKEDGDIYSVPFLHVGGRRYEYHLIKRLFKNSDAIQWSGLYGYETLTLNCKRVRSRNCPKLSNHFYHLGGLCPPIDNRKHDYSSFQ